jgi:DNA processing protein
MKYTENALNIFTAKSPEYKDIGNAWIVEKLKGNEKVETIVSLINEHKTYRDNPTTVDEFIRLRSNYKKIIIEKFEDCCDGLVALGDPNFPQIRGEVNNGDKPVVLFYKGDIELLSIDNKNITVIGLLNPEGSIEERERKIVANLVKNGATIVSGLAFGCDSISHIQTLDSNGKTVAVLPSPLNSIMPARNKGLAYQIVEEGGLLVTEYGNDYKNQFELSSRYQQRDRLQALFCDTIILAASYAQNSAERWKMFGQKLDSGARLAMGYAKKYGIPRAVMYDADLDSENPMFDLNRDLINEEKTITIISQNNIEQSIIEIMQKKPKSNQKLVTKATDGLIQFPD